MARTATSTVRDDEVARFSALADSWWDPSGAFRPLHKLNAVRLAYLREQVAAHWQRSDGDPALMGGLRVVDVGCGGGLLAEPLCRLGARVTGIDASEESVAAARQHAVAEGLAIDYRCASPEQLSCGAEGYDLAVAMEIVEHVEDVTAFLAAVAGLVRTGGLLAFSTLNRTLRSLALGKVAAEYVLGWVPPGTHDWRRFVRPSELAAGLRAAGCETTSLAGVSFDPLRGDFRRTGDVSVNYMAVAVKRA